MGYGKNMRRIRKAAGVGSNELARKLGVSGPYISQLERKSKAMRLWIGERLEEIFGCTPEDIIRGTEGDDRKVG